MIQAFRVLVRTGVEFERYGWLYVVANMLSILLSIPIVTVPVAFAALSHLCHTAQTGDTATIGDFWEGFRLHFRRGITAGIINVVVLGVLWVNLSYYGAQTGLVFVVLRVVWITALVAWFGVQLYLWPILDEMETPALVGGLRNAAVMFFQNPFFTLTLLIVLGILVMLSTALVAPWLLLTNSLLATTANAAVLNRLSMARARRT